jgi:hypothetical protein
MHGARVKTHIPGPGQLDEQRWQGQDAALAVQR